MQWESSNETVTHWQHHLLLLITRRPLSTSLLPTATHWSNGRVWWVSPQLMQTSVVIEMGSPSGSLPPSHPRLLHLSPLLLWRQLIWVRHEAPLRFRSRAENEQILPPARERNGNLSLCLMSGTLSTDRAAWILNSIKNVMCWRNEKRKPQW